MLADTQPSLFANKSHVFQTYIFRLSLVCCPLESQQGDETAGVAEVDAGGEFTEPGVLGAHHPVAPVEGERDLKSRIHMQSQ